MDAPLKALLVRSVANGRLALAANLLYDLVFVGWLAFAGLYAIEILLPTFIMARLSLVKFALLLLVLTALLATLGRLLTRQADASGGNPARPWLGLTVLVGLGIIALAHYRFPWWSIPLSVGGYALVGWLFLTRFHNKP